MTAVTTTLRNAPTPAVKNDSAAPDAGSSFVSKGKVRVRESHRNIDPHNPLAGRRWTDDGKTLGFEVVGPCGVITKHSNEKDANISAEEWQDFYENIPARVAVRTKRQPNDITSGMSL